MAATTESIAAFPEGLVPERQRGVYREVLRLARAAGVQFAVGGAFGFGAYTGQWRNTKDLDLFVLPEDRDAMIEVFGRAGLGDYYGTVPYDRQWIYRGHREDTIVDVIWAMANQRARVDQRWFSAARAVQFFGEPLLVIPPEEMLWQKLYIVQRDRCDWPDVLNIACSLAADMDWGLLLERLGDDRPLLRAALSILGWLAPGRARLLPLWLWERLETAPPEDGGGADIHPDRAGLLDRRPWFQTR